MIIRPIRAARQVLCMIAAASAFCCAPAHAYGPFDGTDASVVQPAMVELELNAGDVRVGGERSLYLPAVVAAYGVGIDTEMAIAGRYERRLGWRDGAVRGAMRDTAISIKHVLRRGSLQDQVGVSIAAECSLLLPEVRGDSGTGAACAGAISQQWQHGALHLNAGYTHSRLHTHERSAGVIIEGPEAWTVRPAAELTAARETGGAAARRAWLLGAIWKHGEVLSLHLALRRERSGDARLSELRLGLTWPLWARK